MSEPASTQPAPPRRIGSLSELSELLLKPRTLVVPLETGEIELQVRGLTGVEASQVDRLAAPTPPPKFKKGARGLMDEPDGFNYDDPVYLEAYRKYNGEHRASIVDLGLVGSKVPGDNLEQKSYWLRENLPPRAVDLLVAKIKDLTSNPIALASFASANV